MVLNAENSEQIEENELKIPRTLWEKVKRPPTQEEKPIIWFCLGCGKRLSEDALFCSKFCQQKALDVFSDRRFKRGYIKKKDPERLYDKFSCVICGKEFRSQRNSKAKYCSQLCRKIGDQRNMLAREEKKQIV